jgi:GcrA cell cycle regulator
MGADLWTEDTIEALRRLALEGRSASAIAAALGAPSRNAVIGKANRIGVKLTGGQWKCSDPTVTRAEVGRPRRAAIPRSKPISCKPILMPTLPRERERKPTWIFAEAQVGEVRRVDFEAVRQGDCRWPLGDPTGEDFAFCGLQVAEGRSYCAGHCRMAYRPPNARAASESWRWARWRPQRLPEPSKEAT